MKKRTATATKLPDFMDSNDLRAGKDLNSWNKSSKNLLSSFLNLNRESEEQQHDFKKSKSANNSTLSLHIAAYENSIEGKPDSNGSKSDSGSKDKIEKTALIKKWNSSKQSWINSLSFVQNPFEFPRQQQEDQSSHPEVMQFKASQRLRNPNEEHLNFDERIAPPQSNCPPTSVDILQQPVHRAIGDSTNKAGRIFDFSKFPRRRIAILFLYLGWDYDGLVTQDHTSNTIEQEILDTMIRTKLIESKEAAKWSRCGRTDKGVSGFRQVGSVTVRSTDVTGDGVFWPDSSIEEISRIKSTNELRYDNILNNELPDTIRVIAWAPATVDFNARFDCVSRSYVYLFPRAQLNIENMQSALNAMIGSHDFRNFCRIDMNKSRIDTSYVREIFEANITPLDDQTVSSPYQMFKLKVRGSGFLWHQIRCIVSLVHDIGRGAEDITLVPKLLDINSYPAKPQYTMARDLPLCFFDASYANSPFDWKSHMNGDVLQRLFTSLETKWCELETKAALVKTMMNELKGYGASDDRFEGIRTHISGIRPAKSKAHIPILKRPTCDSLETKIFKFTKKRKLSENDDSAE